MDAVITILREVRDPRDANARHECASMLFAALIATLCGAKNCVQIADFCAANLADLKEFVDLRYGAPSHDSFSRLFRLLDPREMEQALAAFAKALREGLELGPVNGVVAVDGKRLRRGYERGRAHLPPLMISVWDSETRLSLAARASEDGNEVKATLEALKGLNLKGCVVTADALHCHPAMAEAVRAQGADFALKLKGNNGPLYELAQQTFAQADVAGGAPFAETEEFAHDRTERRRLSLAPAPEAANMPGLVMFGRMQSWRSLAGRKAKEFTYYVAFSKRFKPSKALKIVRRHWDVENGLHWRVDMTFDEDENRTRKNYAPHNLAIFRRMAIDILHHHPDNISISRKMKKAAWSKEYMLSLFTHMR
jgi:predicted transposase YbfD/YdcC